jgi:hypothetical protein
VLARPVLTATADQTRAVSTCPSGQIGATAVLSVMLRVTSKDDAQVRQR